MTLTDVVAEKPGAFRATARRLALRPPIPFFRGRLAVEALSVERPDGRTRVSVADSEWVLSRLDRSGAALSGADGEGSLSLARDRDGGVTLAAGAFDAGRVVRLERAGFPETRLGRWTGRLEFGTDAARRGERHVALLAHGEGLRFERLGAGAAGADEAEDEPVESDSAALSRAGGGRERVEMGAPLEVTVAAEADVDVAARLAHVSCLRVESDGVDLAGRALLLAPPGDLWADGELAMERLDLGRVLAASGLPLLVGGRALPEDAGVASLHASGAGRLGDPDSIRVAARLRFAPPPDALARFAYLRGPFTFARPLEGGASRRLLLADGSPDFVSLDEVPPLFVRAVTIAEDAGFWGHPGIDFQEIPVAFATNLARGTKARGASTISQQLAKNLFLEREKSYGRKLQELALTLLLEAALPKRRILEIYLSVIEWGPGLYGLRPAACHYFGKEPRDLSPKETAFLVALIPGPIKYQRSFAKGTLSTGFEALVTRVLARLRSVDALTEEEYQAARAERLAFRPGLFGASGGERL